MVLARDRLVNIGILPSVNSAETEAACKTGDKCLFPDQKVHEQPNKNKRKTVNHPKKKEKMTTKMLWLL